MKKFKGTAMVGLRENDTKRLVAVYPEPVDGCNDSVEGIVRDWFYKQSCGAEEVLRHCSVDVLSENELRNHCGEGQDTCR